MVRPCCLKKAGMEDINVVYLSLIYQDLVKKILVITQSPCHFERQREIPESVVIKPGVW